MCSGRSGLAGCCFFHPPLRGCRAYPAPKMQLADRFARDYFQLEFFQFWMPRGRLKSRGLVPSDRAATWSGIAVNDFDQVLPISAPSPPYRRRNRSLPRARRVPVTGPERATGEVLRQDPDLIEGASAGICVGPEVPALVRTVRVSVPSLEDARYVRGCHGLEVVDDFQLHTARIEKMWGLTGVRPSHCVVRHHFPAELVEYKTPQPRSWPAGFFPRRPGNYQTARDPARL